MDGSLEFPQRFDESTSQEPIEVVQFATARIHPYDGTVMGSFIQKGWPLPGAKKALIGAISLHLSHHFAKVANLLGMSTYEACSFPMEEHYCYQSLSHVKMILWPKLA